MQEQKVCIIGGGLAGLITAITLARINMKVDLIIRNLSYNFKSRRTTAISQENFNFLKKLDILKFLKEEFWSCFQMKLYTETNNEKISEILDLNKNYKNKIFYMVNNIKIIKHLVKKIKKEKLITLKLNEEILDIANSGLLKNVKFKSKKIEKYNLVILCSGANSNLSKKIFNDDIYEKAYKEIALTVLLKHKHIQNKTARQIFFDNSILALLPISNTKTSIVWSLKESYFKRNKLKKNLFLKKKILIYANNFYKQTKIVSKFEFKDLSLVIRKNYYQDRILLFGDALHVVHPLVGQGFNMILRDLFNLEKILKKKINLGLDIGSSDVLYEFSNEIKSKNFLYSVGIDFIRKFFTIENKSFKKIRNKLITRINKEKIIKDFFFTLANKGFKF